MSNYIRLIEKRASKLALEFCSNNLEVNVEEIASKLGLQVAPHDLGPNVSGVLFIDQGKGTIGFNPNESEVRQRFTIAHEIGHFILHRLENEIFVDKKQFKVMYRDENSATGERRLEREANAFAAALLMPRERITEELNKLDFDLSDDQENVVKYLADTFKVSTQAMMFRISNLNLF